MNSFIFVVASLVFAMVYAFPGHADPMEGGPMNMTGDEPPMGHHNWTGGSPPPHNMTGEHPMGHIKKGDSSEEVKKDRKRRGVTDDLEKVGSDAMTGLQNAGTSAWNKAGELQQSAMSGVDSAGNAIKTGATDLVDKVEKAI